MRGDPKTVTLSGNPKGLALVVGQGDSVLPIKDYNPTVRRPIVTLLIIAACTVIFFFVQPRQTDALFERTADVQFQQVEWTVRNAAIPCELWQGRPLTVQEVRETFLGGDTTACETHSSGPPFAPHKNVYLAVLLSMFLHGGLLHLAGNMLFLWVFGNNIEDRMRPLGYTIFYLVGGLVATATYVALNPNSSVPLVGASGAIAAVMGAYLVLFPAAPVLSIVVILPVLVPASWLLGLWFVLQFFVGPNSGIAWAAHVGGFVFGAVVAFMLRGRLRPPRQPFASMPHYL
jgi:membrane associated rhomboid family serine protease